MQQIHSESLKKNNQNRKLYKWIIVFSVILTLFIVYRFVNPYKTNFLPKCPFYVLTGLKCPGCGSQRALHYLFNLELYKALKENVLMVISIPYILLGAYFDIADLKTQNQLKLRKALFGTRAILVILVLVIGYWIFRNVAF